jgi:hypothetical protein
MEFNVPGTIRRHGLRWSARGLARWLNNPILRGVVSNRPGQVEPLISWGEWQQARRLMESRTIRGTRAPRVVKTFSGMVRCSGCQRWLHYAVAHGKPRLKCTCLLCPLWGRGLAEWKIQAQVIEALRGAADQMATIAAAPVAAEVSTADQAKRQQVAQLEALAAEGVQGLEPTIEALRLELLAPPPVTSVNWAGYRELLARPGVLEVATVEELRAVVLELVKEVRYVGDPNRVEVRLRGGPSGDAT